MDLTQADRDELRGQDWMRGLSVAEHAALPIASRDGRAFYARCGCSWQGAVHWARGGDLLGPTTAKARAQADADVHHAEYRGEK